MISASKRAVKHLMVSGLFAIVALTIGFAGRAWAANGVIQINQAKVNAAGGFPYVISNPGTYILTGNLTVATPGTNGIDITAPAGGVTINFNGFGITGPGSGSGIGISGGASVLVTLQNGGVSGFNTGVALSNIGSLQGFIATSNTGVGVLLSSGGSLQNVWSASNGSDGIKDSSATSGVICNACISGNNGGNGLNIPNPVGVQVQNSNFYFNTLNGMYIATGGSVQNSSIVGNGAAGIVSTSAQIESNFISGNQTNGIALVPSGYINACWNNNVNGTAAIATGACAPAGANLCNGSTCP